jgi:aconitate hydratase
MYGALREGVTATDLALQVTQMLRARKVVGKFVEFYGEGATSLPLPDRATIANMAPEYGATMGFFPVDAESVSYLRATGRTEEQTAAFEAYFKAQKMFGMPRKGEIDYSVDLELDLSTVLPSVAGPKRPQDRIDLPELGLPFATCWACRPPRAAMARTRRLSPSVFPSTWTITSSATTRTASLPRRTRPRCRWCSAKRARRAR